jgi:hypothetical protein
MLFNTKKWSLAGLLLLSSSMAYAAPITASFGGVADGGNSFNQFSVTADDVTVTVSGWSDTKNHGRNNAKDNKIERAKYFDKNTNGSGSWAMTNMDEENGRNTGYGHSADNFGSGAEKDYDFFMLAFSEAVSLTQATYGWINGGSNKVNQNQVSVVALNSATVNNTLNNRSWGGVMRNHTLSSDSAQMQKSGGYFTNFAGTNVDNEFSTHWLIGSLNSVFGGSMNDEGDDGMKLAGVSFNKQATPPDPTSVPEPSSILLFCLAIIGLAASGRRKLQ